MKNIKNKNILFILSFFLTSLVIGNFVLFLESDVSVINLNKNNNSVNNNVNLNNNNYNVTYSESIKDLRPQLSGLYSLLFLFVGIFIGTFLFLLLIKYKKQNIAKGWFFLSYFVSIGIFFSIFLNQILSFIISFVLVMFKVFKSNQFIHNVTEIMIYVAISYIFVPLFNIYYIFILLIIISIYDYIAVFKSKHMVTLAKSQTNMNLFTGFKINANKSWFKFNEIERKINNNVQNINDIKNRNLNYNIKKRGYIILGGGDVIFSMLFTGTIFTYLLTLGMSKIIALIEVYFISVIISLFLFILFKYSKKTKFYPAMPIISLGSFFGFLIIFLFNNFVFF